MPLLPLILPPAMLPTASQVAPWLHASKLLVAGVCMWAMLATHVASLMYFPNTAEFDGEVMQSQHQAIPFRGCRPCCTAAKY